MDEFYKYKANCIFKLFLLDTIVENFPIASSSFRSLGLHTRACGLRMLDVKGTHEMQDGRSSPCGSLHLLEARVLLSQSQQPSYMHNCPLPI
jgi:hypothetical protein